MHAAELALPQNINKTLFSDILREQCISSLCLLTFRLPGPSKSAHASIQCLRNVLTHIYI